MAERFIKINGFTFCLTQDTQRFRRHWKTEYKVKVLPGTHCTICGAEMTNWGRLRATFDHDPPLRDGPSKTGKPICRSCHSIKNSAEAKLLAYRTPLFIKRCPRKHHTYFDDENAMIYCKTCKYVKYLRRLSDGVYEEIQ